jgi:hypothetical protein
MATTQATIQSNPDQTVTIFDSFYNTNLVIGSEQYNLVYSYFIGTTGNTTIAANFTSLLFRIAQTGNYNVIELLQVLQGTENTLQLNSVMCYYLNTFRAKVSLYGISNIPVPNQPVQRNVVL